MADFFKNIAHFFRVLTGQNKIQRDFSEPIGTGSAGSGTGSGSDELSESVPTQHCLCIRGDPSLKALFKHITGEKKSWGTLIISFSTTKNLSAE
jgi:hypothetical protein